MNEDEKLTTLKSRFVTFLAKSVDGGLLEDFDELRKAAEELSLKGQFGLDDRHFVDNIGQILEHQNVVFNLEVRTISVTLSDEVTLCICEKILSSASSRIWLVEFVIDKKSSFHQVAKRLLASKPESEVCEIVVGSCLALIGSKRWTSSKALEKDLKLRAAIIPKSWTVREMPQILRVAFELNRTRLLNVSENWIANLLTPKKAVELGQLIERTEFDLVLSLLHLLTGMPLIQKNARGLLSLLITNSGSNLEDIPASIWEGVEADRLITFLDGIRGPRSVLISGNARDAVLIPALVQKFSTSGKAWEYLKLTSEFPELKTSQLSDLVANKRDRSSREKNAIREFVDAFASERLQREEQRISNEYEDQLSNRLQGFEEEEFKLNQELKLLSTKHASLEDRLRELMEASQGAHQADIRQGRLDILRQMIKHLDSLRLICPLLEGISSTADELVNSVELSLTHFSVEIVGQVDAITTHNSEFFEYIGSKEIELCRILSPAYLIDGEGGEKLVLKKGVCSQI